MRTRSPLPKQLVPVLLSAGKPWWEEMVLGELWGDGLKGRKWGRAGTGTADCHHGKDGGLHENVF